MIHIDKEIIIHNLEVLIKDRNINKTQLAKSIGIDSYRGLSDVFHYRRNLTVDELYRICKTYEVSADWLLGIK